MSQRNRSHKKRRRQKTTLENGNKKIIITIDKHPTTYHCKHKYQYLKADMKQFFYYRHCITPLLMYRYYHERNHFSSSSLQTKYIIFPWIRQVINFIFKKIFLYYCIYNFSWSHCPNCIYYLRTRWSVLYYTNIL